MVKQAHKSSEKFANERNDFHMQSLVRTSDMIAAEAKYHPSCCAEYTRPKNKKQTQSPEVTEYKHYELEAVQIVVANCHEMIWKQTSLKLQDLTAIMKDHLHKNGLEITSSTKKNSRRNIENTFGNDIKFINVNRNVLLYPQSMTVETAILELYKENKEENMISKVVSVVRKEVKDLKDELPLPPQTTDLEPEKFNIPQYLKEFLTSLLGGKDDVALSSWNATIRYSMAQDIVYNLNHGRVKTPKSVLLPSVFKTLTNNTEIINIINRLGHGVSYSILSQMPTEKPLESKSNS